MRLVTTKTTILLAIYFASYASESLPACNTESKCDVSNSHCPTPGQPCVCNDGYHETADFTNCIEDIEPGKECLKAGEETECVGNATCIQTTTPDTLEKVSTCMCNEGYHRAETVNGSIVCEKNLAPGATCTHGDNNLECVSNATCRNSSDEAVNSTMKCTCDNGFHEDPADQSGCKPDLLKPGENCTKEGSSDECSDNAVCLKTVRDGHPEQLQCQCNNDYHNTTDSSGNAICEMDTCDDSLTKCRAIGFNTCTEVNTQVTCILSSRCNSSITLEVEKYWVALNTTRDNMTNCNYTAGNSCKEEITACFNVFLKTETSCSSLDTLTTCLNQTTCNASKQEEEMLSLAMDASSNKAEERSCKCVSDVDQCVAAYNSRENTTEQAQLCTLVNTLLDCVFKTDCDPQRSVDHQKLSQAWSLALDRAKTNQCSLTTEEAKSCGLQAIRCSLLYASGIQNATSKDQQCRSVVELKQCLDLNTTECRQEELVMFQDQQKAATVSFNCGCLMTLDTCDNNYSQQIQNSSQDATRKCLAVSAYLSCILQGSCNLSDPVDSTRLTRAQSMANGYRDSNNCKISQTADGSCDGDIVFCSNEYNSALNAQSTETSKKCDASRNLLLCLNAARCPVNEGTVLNTTIQAADFKLQSLDGCLSSGCYASYLMVLMCNDTYTRTPKNTTQETCSAMNNMVRCLTQKMCNTYLTDSVHAQYKTLVDAKSPSCQLLSLSTDTGPVNGSSFVAVLLAVIISSVIASF